MAILAGAGPDLRRGLRSVKPNLAISNRRSGPPGPFPAAATLVVGRYSTNSATPTSETTAPPAARQLTFS